MQHIDKTTKNTIAYQFYGMRHEKSIVARDEINSFNAVYKASFEFLKFHNMYFNIIEKKIKSLKGVSANLVATESKYQTSDRQERSASDKTT